MKLQMSGEESIGEDSWHLPQEVEKMKAHREHGYRVFFVLFCFLISKKRAFLDYNGSLHTFS